MLYNLRHNWRSELTFWQAPPFLSSLAKTFYVFDVFVWLHSSSFFLTQACIAPWKHLGCLLWLFLVIIAINPLFTYSLERDLLFLIICPYDFSFFLVYAFGACGGPRDGVFWRLSIGEWRWTGGGRRWCGGRSQHPSPRFHSMMCDNCSRWKRKCHHDRQNLPLNPYPSSTSYHKSSFSYCLRIY